MINQIGIENRDYMKVNLNEVKKEIKRLHEKDYSLGLDSDEKVKLHHLEEQSKLLSNTLSRL